MINLLITFIIYACIFGVAWWIITILPVPPMIRTIGFVLLGVCVIVVLLSFAQGGLAPIRLGGSL